MTLGFRTKLPTGEPTYFPEKIMNGFGLHVLGHGFDMNITKNTKPKIHSIREDKSNRWKPGMKIHFVIENRTKNRFQFAPTVPAISIQKIDIYPKGYGDLYDVWIDDILQTDKDVEKLAINDGFESVDQFKTWFNKDFEGKIIHWTKLKY